MIKEKPSAWLSNLTAVTKHSALAFSMDPTKLANLRENRADANNAESAGCRWVRFWHHQ